MFELGKFGVAIIMGIAIVFAFVTFASDLGTNYNINMPSEFETTANKIMSDMNETSKSMESIISGGKWYDTAFNLIFKAPIDATKSLIGLIDGSLTMIGLFLSTNTLQLPIPSWVSQIATVVITFTIAIAVLSALIKWRV